LSVGNIKGFQNQNLRKSFATEKEML